MRNQKMGELTDAILKVCDDNNVRTIIGALSSSLKIVLDDLPEKEQLGYTTAIYQILAVKDVRDLADKMVLMEAREDSTSLQ